jgi:signal transduction histidine kinase
LGLNITKSLVEMHGGHIWFESRYREGTTFYFALPVAEQT